MFKFFNKKKWISCSEKLPELIEQDFLTSESESVLVRCKDDVIRIARLWQISDDEDFPRWQMQGRDGLTLEGECEPIDWLPLPKWEPAVRNRYVTFTLTGIYVDIKRYLSSERGKRAIERIDDAGETNTARKTMWKIKWDNDTGPNDGYYVEWWNVTNGETTFQCESESDAQWLADLLHGIEPPNTGGNQK